MVKKHFEFDFSVKPSLSWLKSPNASLSDTVYEYYYDYTTESLAADWDLYADDWLYDLMDVTGKLHLLWLPVYTERRR